MGAVRVDRFGRPAGSPSPPVAPAKPVVGPYQGTTVVDPYRWVENRSSPEFIGFLLAQGACARGAIDRTSLTVRPHHACKSPRRSHIRESFQTRFRYRFFNSLLALTFTHLRNGSSPGWAETPRGSARSVEPGPACKAGCAIALRQGDVG